MTASARQIVAIIDETLGLAGVVRHHADTLRAAGMLVSSQGKPETLPPDQIAALLLSCLVGNYRADGHAVRVAAYAAARTGDGGPTLGEMLAKFVEDPHGLFELKVDMVAPGASITLRQADHGIATVSFHGDGRHDRPAFDQFAILSGGLLVRIAAAIQNAPEVKAGRRRRNRKKSNHAAN